MKYLYTLCMLLLLLSCGTKQQTTQTTLGATEEQAFYEVLNFCLNSEYIAGDVACIADKCAQTSYSSEAHTEIKQNRGYFSNAELEHIYKQHIDTLPKAFDKNRITRPVTFVSYDKIAQLRGQRLEASVFWEKFNEELGTQYTLFSKPLFSPDYRTAIISCDIRFGPDSCSGATYILHKDDTGAWQLIGDFSIWKC